jgi:hypothetical protein
MSGEIDWGPMKRAYLLLLVLLLAGCATSLDYYQKLPWARVSVDQAAAECTASAGANPLLNYYHCMDAKGWRLTQR